MCIINKQNKPKNMNVCTFDKTTLFCVAYTNINITHSKSKNVQQKCFDHTSFFQSERLQCLNKLNGISLLTNENTNDKT